MPDEQALNSDVGNVPPPPIMAGVKAPRRVTAMVCLAALMLLLDGLIAAGLLNTILSSGGNIVRWVGCGWNVAGSIALLTAGIGLLLGKPWSRLLAVISVHLTYTAVAVVVWVLSGETVRYRPVSLVMTGVYLALAVITTGFVVGVAGRKTRDIGTSR